MPRCPSPECKREMTFSEDASSLLHNVYYCFNHSSPIRIEKKSGLSWALTGAKVVAILALTGIPDLTDAPDLIDSAKEFFSG